MGRIEIEGMEFYSYHGFMSEEQVIGNNYLVDLKFNLNFEKALNTDHLDGTINYASVYDLIKEQMEVKSKLLEHVAGRILKAFQSNFSNASNIELRISKLRPPVNGVVEKISIILSA